MLHKDDRKLLELACIGAVVRGARTTGEIWREIGTQRVREEEIKSVIGELIAAMDGEFDSTISADGKSVHIVMRVHR